MIEVIDYRNFNNFTCAGCGAITSTVYVSAPGRSNWWCKDCLFENMATSTSTVLGDQVEGERECSECGDVITSNESAVCYGCANHDECHGYEDCDVSSCSWCGDDASYCSANCAIASGDTVECRKCDGPTTISCDDEECNNHIKPEGSVPTLAAASPTIPVTVDDDGTVEVSGIEFSF